ncbi:MAG: hypothetical protein Tsb0020_41980 [Haliangiales bacterium]
MRQSLMRQSLLVLTALAGLFLAGCEIYIEPSDPPPPSDCGPWGCEPDPGTPGGDCGVDADCMAGCFCNADGWCEESGFCDSGFECNDGFECDDRATCVPSDGGEWPEVCNSDDDCPYGSFCEEEWGECVGSWTCWSDDECGPGWGCDDRGTCVPMPCEDNNDCAEGCFCDGERSECEETGFCEGDDDCAAQGYDGYVCDQRSTCVPAEPTPGDCYGEIACDVGAPTCAEGSTAAILDGCYTGSCIPLDQCKEEPLPTCDQLPDEDSCYERTDCSPTYIGVDCTCEGGGSCRCTADDVTCSCASYDYAGCVSL